MLADSSLSPLSPREELIVAHAAYVAGMLPRAAAGYAKADRDLDPANRYAYAMLLSRLGRDVEAAAQFNKVPPTSSLGRVAAYQRARMLLHAGQTSVGR